MFKLENCSVYYDKDSKMFSVFNNDCDNETVMKVPLESVELNLSYADNI